MYEIHFIENKVVIDVEDGGEEKSKFFPNLCEQFLVYLYQIRSPINSIISNFYFDSYKSEVAKIVNNPIIIGIDLK